MSDQTTLPAIVPETVSSDAEIVRLQTQLQLQQRVLDTLPFVVMLEEMKSRSEFILSAVNKASRIFFRDEQVIGKRLEELFSPEDAERATQRFLQCYEAKVQLDFDESFDYPTGKIWTHTSFIPILDEQNQVYAFVLAVHDITAIKERELVEQQRRDEIIAQQTAALAEISTPLLTISETTLVMPLIGAIDSQRVQQIMDNLLHGVAERRAQAVILDITGVPVVDTQMASALVRAAEAVSLLGCRVILTGIRPEVAQTLVGLGIELRDITTRATLQDGITYVLRQDKSASQDTEH